MLGGDDSARTIFPLESFPSHMQPYILSLADEELYCDEKSSEDGNDEGDEGLSDDTVELESSEDGDVEESTDELLVEELVDVVEELDELFDEETLSLDDFEEAEEVTVPEEEPVTT